jgi:8-oxo-dGTP pyrophosphatase MutT (NUDIX family)
MKPLAFAVDSFPHAAGILLTHGDRALFLKRADNAKDHAGEWCCPGGSIEPGETPEQAAARELQEETGMVSGDFSQIDEGDGFVTFRQTVDAESDPTLNEEHTEFRWAPLTDPPQPLHSGVAATLGKLLAGDKTVLVAAADSAEAAAAMAQDRREYDQNNWFEVLDNPLSKVGVYQYSEASVKKGGDRNKMVGVYRPAEELGSQECINSFRLMPWTDDHPATLFGDKAQGFASTEDKGVRGVIGEKVYFKDGTLYGNLKVFSEELARKIAGGKKELSCGYHCDFIKQEGVFEGQPYQYVQRNMRGNHVSSVSSGRMGSEVRVLDSIEVFTFALDLKEATDSTELATRVAGESVSDKDASGHSTEKVLDMNEEEMKKKEAADRKAARDASRSARDSKRGMDSMSSEEEEGMDAAECAEDAEEEKDDEKDESKEAKDRGRARDRRAGARDARKGARDKAKGARDAKAAQDAADAAAKGKGMDASEITVLVRREIAAGGKALDAGEIVKLAVAQVVPAIRKEEAAKASLYGRVSPIIGAFDHAEMTHTDMATYALDKLGAPKGSTDPVSALDFYLAGRTQVIEPRRLALDGTSTGAKAIAAKFLS